MEKSGKLLQIEKAAETSNVDLTCYVFSLEEAVAHLAVTNPSGILTIEKKKVSRLHHRLKMKAKAHKRPHIGEFLDLPDIRF